MSALLPDGPWSLSASGFSDGLGTRLLVFDRETGDMLERLVLRPELSAFEHALNGALERAAGLEDERFARPRRIERDAGGRLTVVSEFVPGRRLLDTLETAAAYGLVAGLDAALGLLLELLPAIGSFHDGASMPHGTIGAGRLLFTPAGQLVLLDGLYAAALERLQLTRLRLWNELGIAAPIAAGPARFDFSADLAQAAVIGAAMIAGRPRALPQFSQGLDALRTEIAEVAQIRGSTVFATALGRWFDRLLPIAGRKAFSTADEAALELRQILRRDVGIQACQSALTDFLAQVDAAEAERLERERREQDRVAAARVEEERAEAERREQDRIAAERREEERREAERQERLEVERREQERIEAERREQERIEAERREQDRLAAERREEERREAERRERLEAERREKERIEAERREKERIEAERREQDRIAAERREAERREKERLEAERREKERIEAECREKERLEAERREKERIEAERREQDRIAAERREAERREKERLEAERREKERIEAARREKERIEADRREKERIEAARREKERIEAERREKERVEAARREKERIEAERREKERIDAERREKERVEAAHREKERIDTERREKERLELERREKEREEAERREPAAVAAAGAGRRRKRDRSTRARKDRLRSAQPPAPTPEGATPAPLTAASSDEWIIPPDRAAAYEPPTPTVQPPAPPVYHPPAPPPQALPAAWIPVPQVPVAAPLPKYPSPAIEPPLAAAPASSIYGAPAGLAPTAAAKPIRLKSDTATIAVRPPPTASRRPRPIPHDPLPSYTAEPPPTALGGGIPWRMAAAAIIVLVVGIAATRVYLPERAAGTTADEAASTAEASDAHVSLPPTTGELVVTTQPGGARVLLDGEPAGETPLTVKSVTAGRHVVTVVGAAGAVRKTVMVDAGGTITLDVPVFSGWAAIFAPIVLDVAENGRSLGTTEHERILLSPGHHELRVSNDALNYTSTVGVDIEAGGVKALTLDPRTPVNLNALPWAEVWIDGEKAGETPIANLPVRLGVREIVFRNPQYGERRIQTTIKVAPDIAFSVDFTKPEVK